MQVEVAVKMLYADEHVCDGVDVGASLFLNRVAELRVTIDLVTPGIYCPILFLIYLFGWVGIGFPLKKDLD